MHAKNYSEVGSLLEEHEFLSALLDILKEPDADIELSVGSIPIDNNQRRFCRRLCITGEDVPYEFRGILEDKIRSELDAVRQKLKDLGVSVDNWPDNPVAKKAFDHVSEVVAAEALRDDKA